MDWISLSQKREKICPKPHTIVVESHKHKTVCAIHKQKTLFMMKSLRSFFFLFSSLAGIWIVQADDDALFANCESAIASADADSNNVLTTTEYTIFLADFLSMCSVYASGTTLTPSQYTAFNGMCIAQNGLTACADITTATVDYSSDSATDANTVCTAAVGAAIVDGCDPTQSMVQVPTLPPQSLSPDFDVEECTEDLVRADEDQNDILMRAEYSQFLAIRHRDCYTTGEPFTPVQEAAYVTFSCFFCFQQTQNVTCCLGDDVGISIAGARNATNQQALTNLIAVCGSADAGALVDCAIDGTTTTPLPPALPSTLQPSTPVSQPTDTFTSAPASVPNNNSPAPTWAPVEVGGDSPTTSPVSSASATLSWNGMYGMFVTITWTILMGNNLDLVK
jgi:hypothetical protein